MGKRGRLKSTQVLGAASLLAKPGAAGPVSDELVAAPRGLTSGARRRWSILAPILAADGRLTADTRETLILYVQTVDEAERLALQVEREGATVSTPHGVLPHPGARILGGLRSTALRYSAALGLDPASRARLASSGNLDTRTPEQKQADEDLAQFFA